MENLERGNLYGWVDDLPENTKEEFLDMLRHFRNKFTVNILEIGLYTGCSLIEILNRLPQAKAVGIDPWENYNEKGGVMEHITSNGIENMFNRNLQRSKFEKRVKIYKGRSSDILPYLIEEKQTFDFIYIDGSHKCLDTFLDCVLSWKLLNKAGILAIDDYVWGLQDPVLERPYEGVNRFLELYKDEYKILSKNYRVFLYKL